MIDVSNMNFNWWVDLSILKWIFLVFEHLLLILIFLHPPSLLISLKYFKILLLSKSANINKTHQLQYCPRFEEFPNVRCYYEYFELWQLESVDWASAAQTRQQYSFFWSNLSLVKMKDHKRKQILSWVVQGADHFATIFSNVFFYLRSGEGFSPHRH